jgi:sugar phosphate permease
MRERLPLARIASVMIHGKTGRISPHSSRELKAQSMKVLFITLMVQAMVVAAALAPAAIAPAMSAGLGLPVSALGIFISTVYLGAVGSALYSGRIIAEWGAIRTSQIGLLLCALGLAFVTTGVAVLGLVGALLIGLGYGPITPASSHLLIRTTAPHRLSTIFSIKQTGVPLGGVIVGLAVPPQQELFGWAWALLSISAACMVTVLLAQTLRSELDGDRLAVPPQSFFAAVLDPVRLVFSQRNLLVLAMCSFVFAGVQMSLSAYLPSYLNLHLGWSLPAAGIAMSVVQAAGMAGRIFWGAISDRGLGAHKTLMFLAGLMVLGCIATAMFESGDNHFWIYAVLIVFGATAVGWNGVYLAEVARLAPHGKAGLATGGTLAFTFFGIVFWSPLFGVVAEAAESYPLSYALLCLPLSACLVLLHSQISKGKPLDKGLNRAQ